MSVSLKTDLALLGRYVFSFTLIAFGAWGLSHERAARVTDPHAIVLGIGLLLVPFFPGAFAAGASKAGTAIVEVWRSYKAVK